MKLEGGCGAENVPNEAFNDLMEEVEVKPENEKKEKKRTLRLTMGRLLWRWRSTAIWIQIPAVSTGGKALEMQLM